MRFLSLLVLAGAARVAAAPGGSQAVLAAQADDLVFGQQKGAASTFSPINPPSIPLAVKSPYLNVWAPSGSLLSASPPNVQGNGGYLAGADPSFWTSGYGADGEHRMAWTGLIQVNNVTYQWMGDAFGKTVAKGSNANQISFEYTATRSIYAFEAGGVLFNATFLTPVNPTDYLRQSIPMSYLHIELDKHTLVGKSVQLYTDIDERWSTGHDYDYQNFPMTVLFDADTNGTSSYFVQRTNPQPYTEFRQRAEWGSVAWAVRQQPGLSSRNNNNVVTQLEFLNRGKLTYDHYPTGGPDNSFAYAIDFDVQGAGHDALFAIGHFRTPLINYIRAGPNGTSYLEDRYGYWMTEFPAYQDAVAFFLNDFDKALDYAVKLDAQIEQDAKDAVGGGDVGDQYAAIVALSVRQAMATIEISVGYNRTSKSYVKNDTLIFLKEISSNGDMSTVDVFFPQFPLLTYLNPDLLRDVMLPIFIYTESGLYPNKWCVHDLGVYPSAFGHNDGMDEAMQVEESGNMILLTAHWAQMVGNKTAKPFLKEHYKILQQWAQFLIEDSLVPAEQLSTDDFAGTLVNQTNLAIKGIEGIAAMGIIADVLNHTKDAAMYRNISSTYIQLFYGYSLSKDGSHTTLNYGSDDSWGTLYNLFGDRLLNLELVAKELYDIQDAWYPRKAERWAVPLDSRHKWAKTDWEMFASATAANGSTRDLFIEKTYDFVSNGRTDSPFVDLMESTTGDTPKPPFDPLVHFLARPVVGGHLMHMAIAKADKANGLSKKHPYAYGPAIKHPKGKKPRKEDEAQAQAIIEASRQGRLGDISTASGYAPGNSAQRRPKPSPPRVPQLNAIDPINNPAAVNAAVQAAAAGPAPQAQQAKQSTGGKRASKYVSRVMRKGRQQAFA